MQIEQTNLYRGYQNKGEKVYEAYQNQDHSFDDGQRIYCGIDNWGCIAIHDLQDQQRSYRLNGNTA